MGRLGDARLGAPVSDFAGKCFAEIGHCRMGAVGIKRMIRIGYCDGLFRNVLKPFWGRRAGVACAKDHRIWDGNLTFLSKPGGGDAHQSEKWRAPPRNSCPKCRAACAVTQTDQRRGFGDECVQVLYRNRYAPLLKQVPVQSFAAQIDLFAEFSQ